MDYGALEVEISDILKAKLEPLGFEAIALPEVEKDYTNPFEKGRVTVAFSGAKLSRPQSTDEVSQEVNLTFSLSVQARRLRGDNGIHKLAGLVKEALLGKRLTDCDRLFHTAHDYVRFEDNVWEHVLDFECTTFFVQSYFDEDYPDETGINLTQVNTNL